VSDETLRIEAGELRRVEVRPGDLFALTVGHNLTAQQAAELSARWRDLVGDVPLLVLPRGAELTVFRPVGADGTEGAS
jgi:hypothetical protein